MRNIIRTLVKFHVAFLLLVKFKYKSSNKFQSTLNRNKQNLLRIINEVKIHSSSQSCLQHSDSGETTSKQTRLELVFISISWRLIYFFGIFHIS